MPNTFISSVAQNVMERVYLNLPNFGKATRAARSTRLAWAGCSRGRWPRPAVRAATSHDAESQPGHFFSDVDVFAFTASSTSLRTPSGVRSFDPISRLSTKSVGAVLTPSDLARA